MFRKRVLWLVTIFVMITLSANLSSDALLIRATQNYDLYFDFESSLAGWDVAIWTEGSQFSIEDNTSNTGDFSVLLKGRTRFDYNLTENSEVYYLITNETEFSFAWHYSNVEGYYIGIIVYTSAEAIYFISRLDYGQTYSNNSNYMVIEFQNEAINTWHNHTVNLYSVFLSYYPTVPEKILSIALLNKGYTGSTYTYYNPSNQTTNFDSIGLSTVVTSIDIPTTNNTDIPTVNISNYSFHCTFIALSATSLIVMILIRKKIKL